jgi:hypothetical protein
MRNPTYLQERTAISIEPELYDKEIHLVGLSNVDGEMPELSDEQSLDPNRRRFDLTIVGEEHIVVVEIKTHNSGFKKMQEYSELLGISDPNKVEFHKWRTVVDKLEDVEPSDTLEKELIEDFRELIKFNSTAETISVSPYGEGNSQNNHLKIAHRTDNIRKTPYASSDPIFALQIESDKKGSQTIRFTPGEWTELMNELGRNERNAIKNADFGAFRQHEGSGQEIHASVGNEGTHQKVLQTSTTKSGNLVVGFKHRNPGSSIDNGQGAFPMLTESEFNTLFEKFSPEQRRRLVEDRDLSVFIEDLGS